MDLSEMQTRAAELEQQISALPAGSVTKKTSEARSGYHRWTENKKRRRSIFPLIQKICKVRRSASGRNWSRS